jgi:hypothetical protein
VSGLPLHEVFSDSYAQARSRFLQAARAAGLQVESRLHPLKGREAEDLAMDIARDGPPDAERLLIISSACHGVEGFCGSGVQVAALTDVAWRAEAATAGVAVLHVHALNPHGFSHMRRVTHENVDLNRNFHDFAKPLPVNEGYREVQHLMLPAEWPPAAANDAAIAGLIAARGQPWFQAAVTAGQYEYPDGMFFGGTQPTWSNTTLREVLRLHGRRAARIAWIDVHTGLGPSGVGERIYAGPDDGVTVSRVRSWWDGGGVTPVTSIYDGSSTSALLSGMMWSSMADECPHAEYTGIAMEYGTLPMMETVQALRADHWLHRHPEKASPALAARIRQQMMDAFYTDTDAWKEQILRQAREAMSQAVAGLSR